MNRIIRGDKQIGIVPIKIIMIKRSENGFKHNDKYDEKFPPVDVSKTIHVKQRYKYKEYDRVDGYNYVSAYLLCYIYGLRTVE